MANAVHVRQVLSQIQMRCRSALSAASLATSARRQNVDGRVDAAVGDSAIELQFHVAGAFEFLENDLIHFGSCFGQCGCNDGQ